MELILGSSLSSSEESERTGRMRAQEQFGIGGDRLSLIGADI